MNNEKFTESFSKRLTFHNGRSLIAPTFHVSFRIEHIQNRNTRRSQTSIVYFSISFPSTYFPLAERENAKFVVDGQWWCARSIYFYFIFFFFFSFFFLSLFLFFVFSSNSYPFSFSIFTRPILLEQKSLSRSMEVDGLLGVSALILLLHSLN